jgi:hypothetical protein
MERTGMSPNTMVLLALALSGCLMNSVVSLEPEGKRVTLVRETDRPGQCKVLGKIQGTSHSDDQKAARKGAQNDFRNQAAELKANFAVVESERAGVRGTTSQHQVVIGGKAMFCQTLEMDEADEKRREEALKRKEEEELKAQQEKERKEQEAKDAEEARKAKEAEAAKEAKAADKK